MMRQRGLDRASSHVAIVNDKIVAVWFVALRAGNAYLIASGTSPSFRRSGLARFLATENTSHLRRLSVRRFQTEVLCDNKHAFDLYASLGMTVARTLDCYELSAAAAADATSSACSLPWADIRAAVDAMKETEPSWQNSASAIEAVENEVECWTISDALGLAAYVVLIPRTATLAQIGVRADRRRTGLGSMLINRCRQNGSLRVLNVDSGSDAMRAFLARLGARSTVSQFEMSMDLVG